MTKSNLERWRNQRQRRRIEEERRRTEEKWRRIEEGEGKSKKEKKNRRRRRRIAGDGKKKGNRVFPQFPNPRHLSLLGRPLSNWLNPNLAMYVVGLTHLDKKYLWFNMGLSISDHIYLDTDYPFIARPFDITTCRIEITDHF